jgi:hypothetical protein
VGWIVAVLLVVMGIAMIAAGSTGSANSLFKAITGIDTGSGVATGTVPTNAASGAGSSSGSSGTSPGNQGNVTVPGGGISA